MEMDELVTLNDEQLKAFKAFKLAYKKCVKANIQFYTVLGSMYFLNGDELNTVGDNDDDLPVDEVADVSCCITESGFSGWADDHHTVTRKT